MHATQVRVQLLALPSALNTAFPAGTSTPQAILTAAGAAGAVVGEGPRYGP